MLILIAMLGLVVFLAREVRHGPTIGRALQTMFGTTAEDEIPRDAGVDTRLRERHSEDEIPGVFVSPREVIKPKEDAEGYFPGVQPALLDAVRDDAFFRAAEYDAWFHLLRILSEAEPADLEKASKGRVSFVQLFQQSSHYRGQIVRLRGTVRGAFPIRAAKNDYGIDGYHQLWLFPDDNPSTPVILFCLEVPDGFPTGMDLVERAEVVGFYFKRLAYEATDTLRTAPALLARGIRWQRAPSAGPVEPSDPGSPWTILATALAFSAALAAYVYWRTRPARTVQNRSAIERREG